IGPSDVARITAPHEWVELADGRVDAVDVPITRGGLLPAPPDTATMKVGYNIEPSFLSGVQVYGNMARALALWDTYPPNGIDPTPGEPILNEGQSISGVLLQNGPVGYPDPYVVRERQASEVVNPYYDSAEYGTRGWRPGYGYRTIPVRGTIEVV